MGGTNKLTTSNDDDAPDFKEEDDDEVTADSSNQKVCNFCNNIFHKNNFVLYLNSIFSLIRMAKYGVS